MKKWSVPILFLSISLASSGQKSNYRHPTLIGVQFFLNDFKLPSSKDHVMDPGLGIQYLTGLTSVLDFSTQLNGSFTAAARKDISEKKLLLEPSALLRAHLFPKDKRIQPFVSSGLGGLFYSNKASAFMQAGAGIEFNYREVFLLLNTQYRLPFSSSFRDHYYFSVAIAGPIGSRRKKYISPPVIASVHASDRDGDGIGDYEDQCPDRPGLLQFKGCPDADGDGMEDRLDDCPAIFGLLKYRGCPIPDFDQDGINDEEDSCVKIPGVSRWKGCPVPDTDHDSVNDEEDSCMLVAGAPDNKGCPVVRKDLYEEIKKAARNIFFQTNKYQLLPSSFQALNTVVTVLQQNPGLKLRIEGHTDNQGGRAFNQTLSERRAEAVVVFLKAKGITAERLHSVGFGQDRPVDDNSTPEGRAINRRVELLLYN